MVTCIICRFATELDDMAVPQRDGRCICLRCYQRETSTVPPMPRPLRRQLTAMLAAMDAA